MGYFSELPIDMEYMTYLSEALVNRRNKQAEIEKREKLERLASFPIQLVHVDFSEKQMKSYNIDGREAPSYYHIVNKITGKELIPEIVYVDNSEFERILTELNSDKRYIVIRFAFVGKFTKEDRKKYEYLTGNFRYENRYSILDKSSFKLVWKSDKIFGNSPILYNNVASIAGNYVYLPSMETIYEKKCSPAYFSTENYIFISTERDKSAIIIDTHTGKIEEIK